MKTALAAVGLLLALTACGTDPGATATDPTGDPTSSAAPADGMPTAVPPASGRVSTRTLATVMDTGRPELCLGAVAESYPPQCRGIPLVGWDWSEHDKMFDSSGGTRWGSFAVSGTFDGTSMTVESAVPAALYDPSRPPDPTPCEDLPNADCTGPSGARVAEIARDLQRLPGVLTVTPSRYGVDAEVVHDDGSLQAWADGRYGPGVVMIASALVSLTP